MERERRRGGWLGEEQLNSNGNVHVNSFQMRLKQNIAFLFVYSFYNIFNCYKLFLF